VSILRNRDGCRHFVRRLQKAAGSIHDSAGWLTRHAPGRQGLSKPALEDDAHLIDRGVVVTGDLPVGGET
jgi:hypothetical protein